MVTRSKQTWDVGSTVKVGFLTLRITGIESIVDNLPDIYSLESLDSKRTYEFIPHNGLSRTN